MEYDYIIVGAGSAGCVLAERLGALPRAKILLVEAGGSDARFWIKLPLGYAMTFRDPRVNWCYHTARDHGMHARVAYWPRGRVLGGSSSINAMAYVRGQAADFDDWEAAGAQGWNAKSAAETFSKMECHWENGKTRGNGPLRISDLQAQMHPFSRRFLQAAGELDWPITENTAKREGIGYFRSTVHRGKRFSAADAFLRPALKRGNIRLVQNALVEKVEFEGGRATAIKYRVGGKQQTARTHGEVILSAGAINTPQLLQLSGLGPPGLLRAHGIDVVQDLGQVGQGLQDHLAVTHYFAANEPTLNNILGRRVGRLAAGLQYLAKRSGPLSVPVNQVGGFVRSSRSETVPDMQVYCNPIASDTGAGGALKMSCAPGFSLSVQPCRPTSRGWVAIASRNPSDPPQIQPNSLATHNDRQAAIRAGMLLQTLARAPTIRQVTKAAVAPDVVPMCADELLENFRARAVTNFHPTCTCRMGRDKTDSVLNARLEVHGVAGLRVVDASAFPNITSGNTNAPTIMLAMRAAALIAQDYAKAQH